MQKRLFLHTVKKQNPLVEKTSLILSEINILPKDAKK